MNRKQEHYPLLHEAAKLFSSRVYPHQNNKILTLLIHFSFLIAVIIYGVVYFLFVLPQQGAASSMPALSDNPVPWILVLLSVMMLVPGFLAGAILPGRMPLQTRVIIADAFLESIAVFGLVGVFLEMPVIFSLGLFVLSFVSLAANTFRILMP